MAVGQAMDAVRWLTMSDQATPRIAGRSSPSALGELTYQARLTADVTMVVRTME
ncbi:hypothetical protein ABT084_18830 [Streptomyces sp. NPDC002138]|uniref:hypothetical protein n=1 Tax=Streptomyces sp. NPDC002138 TaxID=3154410 RepID=UPI0033182D32